MKVNEELDEEKRMGKLKGLVLRSLGFAPHLQRFSSLLDQIQYQKRGYTLKQIEEAFSSLESERKIKELGGWWVKLRAPNWSKMATDDIEWYTNT